MNNQCKYCLEPTLKNDFCCPQCRMQWQDNHFEAMEINMAALEKENAELKKELEAIKKLERDRYISASKALGIKPPSERKL